MTTTLSTPASLFDWAERYPASIGANNLSASDWRKERDTAMKRVETNAGPCFMAQALRFVPDYLRRNGEKSGEEITDAMWAAGIEAHDRRATGPVFKALLKDRIIERCGFCIRKRGHGTGGGSVYRLRA